MVNTQANSESSQNPKYGFENLDKNITANFYHYEIFVS